MASSTAHAPGRSEWDGGVSPMGVSYGKLMMWFFLLSDAFTFSALLVTYGLVRSSHDAYTGAVDAFKFSQAYWPIPERVFEAIPFFHGVEAPLVFVGIMTFILIMSSVTMVLAVEAGHRMDRKAVEKWMLWTILGGIAFLAVRRGSGHTSSLVRKRVERWQKEQRSLARTSPTTSMVLLILQHSSSLSRDSTASTYLVEFA
jgi:cytochrome c oxidase subunit 3